MIINAPTKYQSHKVSNFKELELSYQSFRKLILHTSHYTVDMINIDRQLIIKLHKKKGSRNVYIFESYRDFEVNLIILR